MFQSNSIIGREKVSGAAMLSEDFPTYCHAVCEPKTIVLRSTQSSERTVELPGEL
jgi:hypothetical protein